jgi:hypothetical protein
MNEKKKARPRIENGSNEKGNWEASSTDCALTLEDGRAGQLLSYGVPLSNFGILQTKTVLHYSSFVATDVLDRFNEPFAVAASFGAGQVRRVVSLQLVEHTRTALQQKDGKELVLVIRECRFPLIVQFALVFPRKVLAVVLVGRSHGVAVLFGPANDRRLILGLCQDGFGRPLIV